MKKYLYHMYDMLVGLSVLVVFCIPAIFVAMFCWVKKTCWGRNNKVFFVGIQEVASNIESICGALKDFNFKYYSLVKKNKYSDSAVLCSIHGSSIVCVPNFDCSFSGCFCGRIYYALVFIKYLIRCDVFYFVWNSSFLPLNFDYFIIRLSGAQLIIMHCGDDVRYRPIQRHLDRNYGLSTWSDASPSFVDFVRKLYFQKISELCAVVLSSREQSTFQESPLVRFCFPMKKVLDFPKKSNYRLKIVHAPSDRKIKGTSIVIDAVNLLRNKGYDFEFLLLENQSNAEIVQVLSSADIVIDQPGIWVARFAIEACSAGCCVIGGNCAKYMEDYSSPVIQFEPCAVNLASTLEFLIINRECLNKKMQECYDFWEKNYSAERFIYFLLQVMKMSAATYTPRVDQRKIVISGASNIIEKVILTFLYWPSCESS